MSGHPINITVAVPAYNSPKQIQLLLASFDELTRTEDVEIIIVDDCSTDETGQIAKAWADQEHPFAARYVRQDRNRGPAAARNRGAQEARGAVVAYTDTDCIVEPEWLENLTRRLDREKGIAGVGGGVRALAENSMAARHYALHKILHPPNPPLYLVTCNCCYYRDLMLDAGGFPEDILAPGGEDVALSIFLYKQGWRFEFEPAARIQHDFRPELSNFVKTWYNYGYGSGLVVHRYIALEELYPEWGKHDLPNYWTGHCIRPTVTGVRSYLRDLFEEIELCRLHHFGPVRTLQALLTRTLERVAYYLGWLKGRRTHFQQAQAKQTLKSG